MMGETESSAYSAWNPGLESSIPERLMHQITLFRPENADVDISSARELADFFGLTVEDYVAFRPERLVIHDLLIRVTADLSVPDGSAYQELGINLRSMVAKIHEDYANHDMERIVTAFETARSEAASFIDDQLVATVFPGAVQTGQATASSGFFSRLLRSSRKKPAPKTSPESREDAALTLWQNTLNTTESPMEKACLRGLLKYVSGIVGHRGRLVADQDLIKSVVLRYVCNTYGSDVVSAAVEPSFSRAVEAEGYQVLPSQENPVVMNVKGASASGKSTIRPQQRDLATRLGVPWTDFALISPDYWRKYLLDYETLGDDFKYAAMLTGQELEIIDKKLDQYMARKASAGRMPHLLIDRFRFDSFTLEKNRSTDSKLLTRFGDRIFMFFMVTPPAETVERAWLRGIKTGRFKAVDDLLYHNIEAYEGMPELFFSWALSSEKTVHYEFLDNDVQEGDPPKTIAFGGNNTMTILDLESMANIERYRKVTVSAQSPGDVFGTCDLTLEKNLGFLARCFDLISDVNLADQDSGYVYASIKKGKLQWFDEDFAARNIPETTVNALYGVLKLKEPPNMAGHQSPSLDVESEKQYTFGKWGI